MLVRTEHPLKTLLTIKLKQMKVFKSKLFQLTLLMAIAIALVSCDDFCDETVYGTNDDGSTYQECITYND